MARTRSQVTHLQVKKEERKDGPKLEQLLHDTKKASNSKSKITKKEKTARKKSIQAQTVKVKSENTDGNKVIPGAPMRILIGSAITTEQIKELIGYIVNDKMSVMAASRKTRMSLNIAYFYYKQYQNDPEHKIPLPRTYTKNQSSKVTQKKIECLINYIVQDKMRINQAACKAELNRKTAAKYYATYMEDPDRKIPILKKLNDNLNESYTQEQIKELIGYIVDDGMTIVAASKKVNMGIVTARKYHLAYLLDPNHGIPVPGKCGFGGGKRCTNNEVKKLIGCIVDDEMSLLEASVMANMNETTAGKYYKQYLEDPNHKIPTPDRDVIYNTGKALSLDRLKAFFHCIIIDKSSVKEASLKANISNTTGRRYYTRYFENPSEIEKNIDMSYSEEKMKKMLEYIQKDKISIKSAAMKVNLCYGTTLRYYHWYLKNPQLGIPIALKNNYTQEDIKSLIDYIEHDNMSIKSAAIRMKMNKASAYRYYRQYRKDPEHKIPAPKLNVYQLERKAIDICSQLIADIYKNNPSIKPIHERYSYSDSSLPDIDIKRELLDEDKKMLLTYEE